MILVKRCHDNVISLSIILVALDIRLALQKLILVINTTSIQQAHQKHQESTDGPSIPEGKVSSSRCAAKIIRR